MSFDLGTLFSDLLRLETELWDAVAGRLRTVHGLELSWFEPMQVIARTPDCRVHDIAAALSITVGGTSKLVDRIEAAGWCRRRENPDDGRSSCIELTSTGRQLLAAATETFTTELHARLEQPLSRRQLHDLAGTIAHLRRALRASPPESE